MNIPLRQFTLTIWDSASYASQPTSCLLFCSTIFFHFCQLAFYSNVMYTYGQLAPVGFETHIKFVMYHIALISISKTCYYQHS